MHKTKPSMAKLHLFPQIARKIPLEIVKAAEEKYKSNKGCQYLDVLTHLLSFLLCHLGDCQSLRDVCNEVFSNQSQRARD